MRDFKKKSLTFSFLGKLFLGLIFFAAIIQSLTNIYKLSFGTYIVDETDIYRVDSFKLQGKAFYNSGRKYHSPSYDFSSTNGYTFSVDEDVCKGIIDKKQFADTFSYRELKFTAYSDRKTAEAYLKSRLPIYIKILQLQIGDKKFISTEQVNKSYKNKLIRNVLISAFLFLFILITFLRTGKIFK